MPFPLQPVSFWRPTQATQEVRDIIVAGPSLAPSHAPPPAAANSFVSYDVGQLCEEKPPNRVVLFLHIYKTGGTTNRELFQHWSDECGLNYAQCGSCLNGTWMEKLPDNNTDYICLHGAGVHRFPTPRNSQKDVLGSSIDVIAGHMAFGFHRYLNNKKYTYITCLRNPMSRFVSAILYEHRTMTTGMTRQEVVEFVTTKITSPYANHSAPYRGIYPAKLSGKMKESARHSSDSASHPGAQTHESEREAVALSFAHLHNSFAVVGLLESYSVFIELVAGLLDPHRRHLEMWEKAKVVQSNKHEGFDQSDVLPLLSKHVVAQLNDTVALDWEVYIEACRVSYTQCRRAVEDGHDHPIKNQHCEDLQAVCDQPAGWYV